MDIITLFGLLGAVSILFAYVMNKLGKWSRESFLYDLVNAFGAFVLIIYAYLITSYPFIVLNTVWFVVAIKGILIKK